MLATANPCRSQSTAMRSTCSARPFFSPTEQDEIALLAEATWLRRAAAHGPAGPGVPAYGHSAAPSLGHVTIGQISAVQGTIAI
ncbi:MAG: hypothetical protein V4505_19440 [Pseudomonadota bacterium]